MTTESSPLDSLRRSVELLWGSRERSPRGPKPGLTLDQIVDAAIAVADTHGVDALSMRRIAAELGVGTMSLYRYVPGKTELLQLMLDKVSDPSKEIELAAGLEWRAAVELSARCARDLYLMHGWLLQVNWTRPVLGPNSVAGVEHFVTMLDGLGLSDQERINVMLMIDGYVTGSVRSQLLYARAAQETGVSDEDFWEMQLPMLEQAMASGDYPSMAALAEDSFAAGWDESFEFGLQRLLDGLAVAIESRGEATES